jgi:hypothetical protein
MDVVSLVVEHGEFVNLPDNFAEIGPAVIGPTDRFGAENGARK